MCGLVFKELEVEHCMARQTTGNTHVGFPGPLQYLLKAKLEDRDDRFVKVRRDVRRESRLCGVAMKAGAGTRN